LPATRRFIDIGLSLHLREWTGDREPFVLLHGLSSNSRTWESVAAQLAAAGHPVFAVDQRGHGLSDKPDEGYDFATITADLARLIDRLKLDRPLLVGQSWGGNVLLEFGARYPGLARGLGFVDGGFLDLRSRPDPTWENTLADLKPPDLNGTLRAALKQRLRNHHPDWTEAGLEATLGNFESLPDGTIRPWLSLAHHVTILRAMWEQQPVALYPQIQEPVWIGAASDRRQPGWLAVKRRQIEAARAGLARVEIHWFENTDHDIHIQRPAQLAASLLNALEYGIWR